MIRKESIERVRETARLVEVASDRLELKARGGNFVALCPFHSEKSPSFHINDNDNYYHCFGCGASGDVIKFVMELDGLSFPEALETLAGRFGIVLEKSEKRTRDKGPQVDKQRLYHVNALALLFFKHQLSRGEKTPSGQVGSSYLIERAVSVEAVEQFGVGVAPNQWRALTEALMAEGVTESELITTGLAGRNRRGELYDVFRGRLMFPVFLDKNRVAGFGGRVLPQLLDPNDEVKAAKYLNSKETPLYKKSQVLYGFPAAQEQFREHKTAYVVEGYLDVVGMWQAGVRNCVATCGTAITTQHAKRLSRVVERVHVLFDGDSAGRASAAKAFEVFMNTGLDASALFLPDGEDPDTFSSQWGEHTREKLAELPSMPLFDCFLSTLIEKPDEVGAAVKGKIAEQIIKMIARVENEVERDELLRRASYKIMIEKEVLKAMLAEQVRGHKEVARNAPPRNSATSRRSSYAGETGHLSSQVVADELNQQGVEAEGGGPGTPVIPTRIREMSPVSRSILSVVMVLRGEITGDLLSLPELPQLDPSVVEFIALFHEICVDQDSSDEQKKQETATLLKTFGRDWIAHWKDAYEMQQDSSMDFVRLFEESVKRLQIESIEAAIRRNEQLMRTSAPEDQMRVAAANVALVKKKMELAAKS